jgi:hypothetical protein
MRYSRTLNSSGSAQYERFDTESGFWPIVLSVSMVPEQRWLPSSDSSVQASYQKSRMTHADK